MAGITGFYFRFAITFYITRVEQSITCAATVASAISRAAAVKTTRCQQKDATTMEYATLIFARRAVPPMLVIFIIGPSPGTPRH